MAMSFDMCVCVKGRQSECGGAVEVIIEEVVSLVKIIVSAVVLRIKLGAGNHAREFQLGFRESI